MSINVTEHSEVQSRVDSLQNNWNSLNSLSQLRTKQLQDAAEAYQVCSTFVVVFLLKCILKFILNFLFLVLC